MTPEGKVKAKIKQMLKDSFPEVSYSMPATGGYGKSGVSDFVLCFYGTYVEVEAKADGNDLKPLQALHAKEMCEACGTHYTVIGENSVGYLEQDLIELREELKHGGFNPIGRQITLNWRLLN